MTATPVQLLVSLYIRLSGAPDEANLSLSGMISELTEHVESKGLTVHAVHVDKGISGGVRDRPEFLAWLEDARSGKVGALAAYHGDRITREGVNAAALVLDVLEGKNPVTGAPERPIVRFISYDGLDSELDPDSFRWRFIIAAEVARSERNSIRRRNSASRRRLRAAHRMPGGRRAWAFEAAKRADGKGYRLKPIDAHAAAIRWALDHLRAGGSKTAIVREWTARGLTPKGSAKARKAGKQTAWHVTPVSRILRNPNLYGAELHGFDVIRNDDGTARIDPQQAILTPSEFWELQGLLDGRVTARSAPDRVEHALLAGLLYCASCGLVMYPHRPEGRTWTYRCRGGSTCPNPTSVAMAFVEPYLIERFHALIGDVPESLGGWEPDVPSVDLDELANLTEALKAADAALSADLSDEDALATLRQRRELRARLALLQDAAAASKAHTDALRVRVSSRTYSEAFNDAEAVADKARLLALAFNAHVTVHPGTKGTFDPSRLEW